MTMIPFTPDTPSYGQARDAATVRNDLNAIFRGDFSPLRPRAQASPDMTIQISGTDVESFWRQIWIGVALPLNFAGGSSPALTAPSTNPRISLLTIDSAGALAWTNGTEAASPSPPNCPNQKIPICWVYCKTTMTKVVNYEDKDSYPNDGYIYRDVRPMASFTPPGDLPGVIKGYGGSTDPTGYFICDGRAISRSLYADLFAVIGTTYGVGDGSSTFNIPDLRQRFPLGKAASGTGSTLGGTGGYIDHAHVNPTTGGPSDPQHEIPGGETFSYAASTTHTHTLGATGANNPPFVTVNYIIKY